MDTYHVTTTFLIWMVLKVGLIDLAVGNCQVDCGPWKCCVSYVVADYVYYYEYDPPGVDWATGCGSFNERNWGCTKRDDDRTDPYKNFCPCQDGLKCVTKYGVDVVKGEIGVCVPNRTKCYLTEDCGKNECCVLNNPDEYMDVLFPMDGAYAYCMPMTSSGGACDLDSRHGKYKEAYNAGCPCRTGNECVGKWSGKCEQRVNRSCETSADCDADECCLENTIRGKRETQPVFGYCTSLNTLGNACQASPDVTDQHFGHCPCLTGLTCVENEDQKYGTCTMVPQCNDTSDCVYGECCVSHNRPKGKRAVEPWLGYCKAMGQTGNECFVNPMMPDAEGLHYDHCPCARRFTCSGNGNVDIPLGEMGTCQPLGPNECIDVTDCSKGQCCVFDFPPKSNNSAITRGQCKDFGKFRRKCFVNPLLTPGGKGQQYVCCPCGTGMDCRANGKTHKKLGEMGSCRKSCDNRRGCGHLRCCVRKEGSHSHLGAPGWCKKQGFRGDKCYVENEQINQWETPYSMLCACHTRHTCNGTGLLEQPYGEVGTCDRKNN